MSSSLFDLLAGLGSRPNREPKHWTADGFEFFENIPAPFPPKQTARPNTEVGGS